MIQCPGCERRLVAQTDFSIIAEPDRLRRNAAREGREVSIIDLQPSAGLSRQRVRMSGEEESQTQKVQSTASTIRAKVLNQQKRADKLNQTPQGQFSVDPIQAHNFAKAGLSFHTVEALQCFANVRLPNPQGKGKGTGTSTWHDASGKLALLWVPGQQRIDLLTECLICFHDRFYTIDEIAVLIKAVKSNQHEFTILCYDGEKHCVVQHEILAIMGELATLFGREIPRSRSSNERSYPTLTNQGELHVPREASGLGRRQLNELLVNTPYFRRHPEYYMGHEDRPKWAPATYYFRHQPQSDVHHHHQFHLDVVVAALTSVQVQHLRSETGHDLPLPGTGPPRLTSVPVDPSSWGDRPRSGTGAGSSTDRPTEPAMPPPRKGRDPSSYISDADWDAIRDNRASESTAPETAASPPPASEAPSSAVDLSGNREWAEPNRRRPHDPPTFGVFFETRGLTEDEGGLSRITLSSSKTAGLLYPHFRLGHDELDPTLASSDRLGSGRPISVVGLRRHGLSGLSSLTR